MPLGVFIALALGGKIIGLARWKSMGCGKFCKGYYSFREIDCVCFFLFKFLYATGGSGVKKKNKAFI